MEKSLDSYSLWGSEKEEMLILEENLPKVEELAPEFEVQPSCTIQKDTTCNEERLDLYQHLSANSREESVTSILPSAQKNIETILAWLSNENIKIINIYGEEGSGRTWIVRQVMDRIVSSNSFDAVLWVNLDDPNVSVAVQIGEQLNLLSNLDRLDKLYERIPITLSDKRFLVIMDELPKCGYLSSSDSGVVDTLMMSVSSNQNKSSKLLFVTSSGIESATNVRNLFIEKLTEEEAWILFCKKAGLENYSPSTEEFAKILLEDCEGMPFPIVTVAAAFGKYVAGSSLTLDAKLRHVNGLKRLVDYRLFLYQMLPSKVIQHCFLYCTHYPEYHLISVEELITSWIVDGIVDGFYCLENAYEKGHLILKELIDRFLLFEVGKKHVTMHNKIKNGYKEYLNEEGHHITMTKHSMRFMHGLLQMQNKSSMYWNYKPEYVHDTAELDIPTTLLLHGDQGHLSSDFTDSFFKEKEHLNVLAILHAEIRSLPSSVSILENLSMLVLRGCGFLENLEPIHELKNLMVLSLSGSSNLMDIPDNFFDQMPGLLYVDLSNTQLKQLPSSLTKLDIRFLILRGCSYLKTVSYHKTLHLLDLSGASALRTIPEEFFYNSSDNLQTLDLSGTLVDFLPPICNVPSLHHLSLRGCSKIKRIPCPEALPSLRMLDLSGSAFSEFQDETSSDINNLELIDLSETQIVKLPSLSSCDKLRKLILRNCHNLQTLPSLYSGVQVLDLSNSTDFQKFEAESLGWGLQNLDLSGTQVVKLPSFSECYNLIRLSLRSCLYLDELKDDTFVSLYKLQILNLSGTPLEKLPNLSNCSNLRQLVLRECSNLKRLPYLKDFEILQVLDLSGATSFNQFQDEFLENRELRKLDLSGTMVVKLPSLSNCSNLSKLILRDCSSLMALPVLEAHTKLKVLDLSGATSFTEFNDETFSHMHDLQILDLSETKISKLPVLSGCISLSKLILRGCSNLVTVPDLKALTQLEVLKNSGDIASSTIQAEYYRQKHELQILDLSGTKVVQLPSLSKCSNIRELMLSSLSNLETVAHLDVLTKIEMLDLSGTKIGELPYCFSKSLKFLGRQKRKYFWGVDWENKNEIPKPLDWDTCAESCSSIEQIDTTKSNAGISYFKGKNVQRFHLCMFSLEERGKEDDDVHLQEEDFVFSDVYYQTSQLPESIEPDKFLKVCGFRRFPTGIEEILRHVELLYVKKNYFIRRLSDLGAENLKVMKECWIEKCDRMESIFYEEEKEQNLALGGNLQGLWISDLFELRSLYHGAVQSESFACLKHLYIDFCPSLVNIFTSEMQLQKLETLSIKFCDMFKSLFGDGESVSGKQTLPKLHTLTLWKLSALQSICGQVLPRLIYLRVKGCPNLLKLPANSTGLPVQIEGEQQWWCNFTQENEDMTSHLNFTPLDQHL